MPNTKFLKLCEAATAIHGRSLAKPNEDCVYADAEAGIFILLDGITRPHKEYEERPGESMACEINECFTEAVAAYLREGKGEPKTLLREAIARGNDRIAAYRSRHPEGDVIFAPGTLGIVAFLVDKRLYYAAAGDCLGLLLRGDTKTCFGEQASVHEVDLLKPTKAERYALYCNHPENPLFYTIYNGDKVVSDICEYASLDLEAGDTVLLASDGIKAYLSLSPTAALRDLSAQEMLVASRAYDAPPYAAYPDDKTVLKLSF